MGVSVGTGVTITIVIDGIVGVAVTVESKVAVGIAVGATIESVFCVLPVTNSTTSNKITHPTSR